MIEFQSAHPVWGATSRNSSCRPSPYFNPRTPCGVRRSSTLVSQPSHAISIHAPRVGCDRRCCDDRLSHERFQSTHPVRGATWPACSRPGSSANFNPRTPCGVRQSTCSATATISRSSEAARAIRKRPRCRCALLRGRFAPRQTFFEEKTGTPVSGTDCIDYRILQKIGLPKRKTEQRSFPNMKATGIVRRIDD